MFSGWVVFWLLTWRHVRSATWEDVELLSRKQVARDVGVIHLWGHFALNCPSGDSRCESCMSIVGPKSKICFIDVPSVPSDSPGYCNVANFIECLTGRIKNVESQFSLPDSTIEVLDILNEERIFTDVYCSTSAEPGWETVPVSIGADRHRGDGFAFRSNFRIPTVKAGRFKFISVAFLGRSIYESLYCRHRDNPRPLRIGLTGTTLLSDLKRRNRFRKGLTTQCFNDAGEVSYLLSCDDFVENSGLLEFEITSLWNRFGGVEPGDEFQLNFVFGNAFFSHDQMVFRPRFSRARISARRYLTYVHNRTSAKEIKMGCCNVPPNKIIAGNFLPLSVQDIVEFGGVDCSFTKSQCDVLKGEWLPQLSFQFGPKPPPDLVYNIPPPSTTGSELVYNFPPPSTTTGSEENVYTTEFVNHVSV